MTSENRTWQPLRDEYLRQIEKTLASVKHPRRKEVIEDVRSHLDRRFAELKGEEQTWENFQAIITEMGPASDYAELLESKADSLGRAARRKHPSLWIAIAVLIVAAAVILPIAIFSRAREADKTDAENLSATGWKLWREHRFAQAEQNFNQAVTKDPTNTNAWNGLGWSQFNQGKPANAKVAFQRCVELQPIHAGALNGLGWIAKGQGNADEAIRYWQRAVEAAPSATAALSGLAATYMETGEYDKAAEVYQKWLKVEPDSHRARVGLENARNRRPAVELSDLPHLIAELSDPSAPRFEALNKIIKLGSAAVPTLIEEMKANNNWQIPKALGAIEDRRAILPLIEKLEASDFSPMREVVAEALERITGEKLGNSKENWRAWWQENQQKEELE